MRNAVCAVVGLFVVGAAQADGDLIELRPVPPLVVHVVPPGNWRTNRLDVWQYLAPDRNGAFKPRVVPGDGQPFYYRTGEPYYQLPVNERVLIPLIMQ